jgi:hypothetical protein
MRTVRALALRFHSDMSITVGKPYDDSGIGTRPRRSLAWRMALTQSSTKPVSGLKLDAKRTEVWRVQANVCTRICARMRSFLPADRERASDRQESRFSLVNRLFSETKRNVLKSMISES